MKQKLLLPTIALITVALAISGLALVIYQYMPLVKAQLSLARWQACASVYRLEYSDTANKTVVVSPNLEEVKACVQILEK